jgi:oxaloacetate decarboxylase alpha subunit
MSTVYTINVNNKDYVVRISEGADSEALDAANTAPAPAAVPAGDAEAVSAPLAGNIWKIHAKIGQMVKEGETLLILEAMKMETEIKAARDGKVESLAVSEGDAVQVGDTLLALA